MHISPRDTDVSSFSHGTKEYTPIDGTAGVVFDVPWELGNDLISFPSWHVSDGDDYGPDYVALDDPEPLEEVTGGTSEDLEDDDPTEGTGDDDETGDESDGAGDPVARPRRKRRPRPPA